MQRGDGDRSQHVRRFEVPRALAGPAFVAAVARVLVCAIAALAAASCSGDRAARDDGSGGTRGPGVTATGGVGGAAGRGGGGAAGAGGGGGHPATSLCAGGATHAYLVRSLASTTYVGGMFGLHGFDLDDRRSDGTAPEDCQVPDGTAPDGRVGIDNTIGGLWGEDLAPAFNQSYARGTAPIVIQLLGVDNLTNDGCVDVRWFPAAWIGAPRDPATTAPGAMLRVDGLVGSLPGGRIVDGRLTVDGDAAAALRAEFTSVSGPGMFQLPLRIARLSFLVGPDALTQGTLGGRVRPEDVLRVYADTFGSLISPGLVSSILRPDLAVGQTACAELSAGFGFEAVSILPVPQPNPL